METIKKIIVFLAMALSLVLVDQFFKFIIRSKGGFYICNSNIAFGLPVKYAVFWGILFLILSCFYGLKLKQFTLKTILNFKFPAKALNNYFYATLLIFSGAVGNLIDRFRFGCVIDYVDLHFWPVFNLADIFIPLGAAGIIISGIKNNKN